MKIKLLPILTGLFITTATMTSCLKSEKSDFVITSDANIYAFNIDTIYGKSIFFSIDHVNGQIFNRDSLPVSADTIINKMRIMEIRTAGATVKHNGEFISSTDSVDLSKPYELKTESFTKEHQKEYIVTVNVHKQDPDLIDWTEKASLPEEIRNDKKFTTSLGASALVYTENGKLYKLESHNSSNWTELTPAGFTINEQNSIKSIIKEDETLYMQVGTEVYSSNDGVAWNKLATNFPIETILSIYNKNIFAIASQDKRFFCTLNTIENSSVWEEGNEVNNNFLQDNYSSAYYVGSHSQNTASMVMGTSANDTFRYAWMSTTGKSWNKLTDNINSSPCPLLDQPIMFSYNKRLYTLGKQEITVLVKKDKEEGDTEENTKPEEVKKIVYQIYTSVDGINWKLAPKKQQLLEDINDKVIESVTVDSNNYIWFTCKDEVGIWRGRLNHLGFDK